MSPALHQGLAPGPSCRRECGFCAGHWHPGPAAPGHAEVAAERSVRTSRALTAQQTWRLWARWLFAEHRRCFLHLAQTSGGTDADEGCGQGDSFLPEQMQLLSARFGPQLPAFSCQCLCLCHLQKPPVLLQNGLVLSAASPRGRFCWVLTASCGRLLPLSLSRETFGALVTSMLGSSCIDWQLEVHLSFFFFWMLPYD